MDTICESNPEEELDVIAEALAKIFEAHAAFMAKQAERVARLAHGGQEAQAIIAELTEGDKVKGSGKRKHKGHGLLTAISPKRRPLAAGLQEGMAVHEAGSALGDTSPAGALKGKKKAKEERRKKKKHRMVGL